MRDMLEQKLARFEELERMMTDPSLMSDSSKMGNVAREHGSLAKLAVKYRRFKQLNDEVAALVEMSKVSDPDEREMAEAEIPNVRAERERIWSEVLDMTVGGEDAQRSRCVMEIRAGVGGAEGALFAQDLYQMYKRFGEKKGWKVELMEASPTDMGGFKEVILGFEGEGVFRELQYESGGHRVQRVPETEAKGRVHTSAATVAVLPEPEDVEVNIKPDEYRLDKFCASGPGGQHVNKTESAVRLTHYETGIVVSMQDEKSQHKNLAKALRILKSRLYDFYRQREQAKRAAERKSLVGSGDRSERIRTYNFPENRCTDHRIGLTLYKLDQIINGDLQPVLDGLIEHDRNELRDQMGVLEI
ncbi:peptide chain release factor 1 [Pirellula staleyi DSM 6068]|uniref:Peptide chain release factor 1 n=1 Tax=Pirellula staleyi (strain ATCC 27377 / DSM 6068 / ICPB 4128) TaxID=530564 RepID=D2R8V5_PIRSD|nr:peptide chain release factor 1 [Pirellula staleyi]ADB19405.1 peptide chain release factor 1 [Pirellula staleyi DSM 6068]